MNQHATRDLRQTPLTVMLVDDSEMQIQYQQALLADLGMAFLVAYDGAEALELCQQQTPDIILLDVEMPGMSGLELTRILRADAHTAASPIIMVSAQSGGEVIEEAFVDGCSEYVVKPIHKADIVAKIQSLTGVQLTESDQ